MKITEQVGFTALMFAAQSGNLEILNLLLAAGANKDCQDHVRAESSLAFSDSLQHFFQYHFIIYAKDID